MAGRTVVVIDGLDGDPSVGVMLSHVLHQSTFPPVKGGHPALPAAIGEGIGAEADEHILAQTRRPSQQVHVPPVQDIEGTTQADPLGTC